MGRDVELGVVQGMLRVRSRKVGGLWIRTLKKSQEFLKALLIKLRENEPPGGVSCDLAG